MLTTVALIVGVVVFAIAFVKFSAKPKNENAASTGEALFGAFIATSLGITAVYILGSVLGAPY